MLIYFYIPIANLSPLKISRPNGFLAALRFLSIGRLLFVITPYPEADMTRTLLANPIRDGVIMNKLWVTTHPVERQSECWVLYR